MLGVGIRGSVVALKRLLRVQGLGVGLHQNTRTLGCRIRGTLDDIDPLNKVPVKRDPK